MWFRVGRDARAHSRLLSRSRLRRGRPGRRGSPGRFSRRSCRSGMTCQPSGCRCASSPRVTVRAARSSGQPSHQRGFHPSPCRSPRPCARRRAGRRPRRRTARGPAPYYLAKGGRAPGRPRPFADQFRGVTAGRAEAGHSMRPSSGPASSQTRGPAAGVHGPAAGPRAGDGQDGPRAVAGLGRLR